MSENFNTSEIVQIAYYVDDVESAARKAHETFGIGPFFVYKNIELENVSYRGRPAELDHTSAYAQNGALMIEFTQQNNADQSTFTDMYPDGGEGLHHMAMFVDNVSDEMQRLNALGCDTTTHYFTREGKVEVAFMDTRSVNGHMLELYQPVTALTKFYQLVAKAARNWDGKQLIRFIN